MAVIESSAIRCTGFGSAKCETGWFKPALRDRGAKDFLVEIRVEFSFLPRPLEGRFFVERRHRHSQSYRQGRIPAKHLLGLIRRIVNGALASLGGELDALYADDCRPSIPPERLIRASLLQILFSIRSDPSGG